MESLHFHLLLVLILVACTVLLSHPVFSNHEDTLIQGLNSYRQNLTLSPLSKNNKAHCLADKLSDQLDKQPCNTPKVYAKAIPASSGKPPFTDYQNVLSNCSINVNHTTVGVVLIVCAPKSHPTTGRTNYTASVPTNYTHTQYAKYLKDSKFTGIGVDSEDDWMVIVMVSSAQVGLVSEMRLGVYLVTLLFSVGLILTS